MTGRLAVMALAVAAAVAGCGSAEEDFIEAGGTPMDGADLQALLAGNTIAGRDDSDFHMFFAADGRVSGRWSTGSDAGTWTVDKNRLCIRWQNSQRRHGCQKAYWDGRRYAVVDAEGDVHYTFSIIEGNPQRM